MTRSGCMQSSSWQAAAHQNPIDAPLAVHNRIFCVSDGPCDRGQEKPCICPFPQGLNPPALPLRLSWPLGRPRWLCRQMQSTDLGDLVHYHLVRILHSLQVFHVICCCLCRQGATVEHILSKIQQEVDILRRMQGRPEALRLHAVFEVGRGCGWGLPSES